MFFFHNGLFDRVQDAERDIRQIVESRGFEFEEHRVTTDDGYILTVHRIVNPFVNESSSRGPVLLQHGLASNSIHWLINSADGQAREPSSGSSKRTSNNLGFALANEGYDVWLANSRGNEYSMEHKTLDAEQSEFWEFSLDDMIEFDLPSTIEHVLTKTNRKCLGFVGISQGTAIMFGLLASKPEYNAKISPVIALAPVVRYTNTTSWFRYVPSILSNTIGFLDGRGCNPAIVKAVATGHVLSWLVRLYFHFLGFCVFGFNLEQINFKRLKVVYAHPVGNFSWKTFRHHNQLFWGRSLRKYDYGKTMNMRKYGSSEPAEYDLSKVSSANICLFRGLNDQVVADKDVEYLLDSIQKPCEVFVVNHPKWQHFDFHFGKDAGKLVNRQIVETLARFDSS